jgi:hypothetical protein
VREITHLYETVSSTGILSRNTSAGATHIVTSQQLSGSKTHKVLSTKPKIRVQVVKPEWVMDSVAAGKRQAEREYAVIEDRTTADLESFFGGK